MASNETCNAQISISSSEKRTTYLDVATFGGMSVSGGAEAHGSIYCSGCTIGQSITADAYSRSEAERQLKEKARQVIRSFCRKGRDARLPNSLSY